MTRAMPRHPAPWIGRPESPRATRRDSIGQISTDSDGPTAGRAGPAAHHPKASGLAAARRADEHLELAVADHEVLVEEMNLGP
jgi:hypothetical protein